MLQLFSFFSFIAFSESFRFLYFNRVAEDVLFNEVDSFYYILKFEQILFL